MRTLSISGPVLTLCIAIQVLAARLLHSLPEDTYAFPKFRVTFLNGLPLLNETAERWLKEGLRGGELEFLDQPWKEENPQTPSPPKEIGSGRGPEGASASEPLSVPNHSLEHMKMGPRDSYLCLIPKAPDNPPLPPEEESDADATPAHSWSLLQPLSGTCLYHRQGWFTYSYCHNEEVLQFKQLTQVHLHSPGNYKPEVDPDYKPYILGRAPAIPEPGADLTVAERNALAENLELARTAGSRYLVRRWGDGTICDKTGKHREVEVQFHCSMAMSDTILFVKEAKTCSYVLVIHTPRLCGEPGFKSRRDAGEEAYIRCREVVDTTSPNTAQGSLPEADHPLKVPPRKPILPVPQVPPADKPGGGEKQPKADIYTDILRALQVAVGNSLNLRDDQVLVEKSTDDGQAIITFVDEGEDVGTARIAKALRAAGFDIRGEKTDSTKEEKDTVKDTVKGGDAAGRDEL